MRRSDPAALQKLRQALEDGGDLRPPLFQFMAANHDELAEMFAGARLNWTRLAAEFGDMGFRAADGGVLRPGTVRQTWYRVRKRRQAARARRAARAVDDAVQVHGHEVAAVRPGPAAGGAAQAPTGAGDVMAQFRAKVDARSGRKV